MQFSKHKKKKWKAVGSLALGIGIAFLLMAYAFDKQWIGEDYKADFRIVLGALIGSFVFVILYQLVADEALVETSSTKAAKAATKKVLQRLELVPLEIFPESDISDRNFEQLFCKSLEESQRYWFKASTGRKVADRLRDENSHIFHGKSVRILLLDPRHKELLTATAESNLRAPDKGNYDAADIQAEALKISGDIYESVAKMYSSHRRNNIDLRFHREYVFYRIELFDNALLLSYTDHGKQFPGSALYESSSKVYRAYERNFEYHFNMADRSVFSKDATQDSSLFEVLGQIDCPEALAKALEKKYMVRSPRLWRGTSIGHLLDFGDQVQGDAAKLALLSVSDPNNFAAVLNLILRDEVYLHWIASNSYHHANGFDKIVLGQTASGSKVRLHMWGTEAPRRLDVHDHVWSFASVVLYGKLTSEHFGVSDGNDSLKAQHFRLNARQNGDFCLERLGTASLCREKAVTLVAGDFQCLDHTVLHSINSVAGESAATLVLHTRKLCEQNNVYEIGDLQERSLEVEVTHFTVDIVKEKLNFVVQELERRAAAS